MFSKQNRSPQTRNNKPHSWIYLTIAVVVIILAIVGVLLSPAIAEYLGKNSTLGSQGGVGGALGGITAPIIGLAGSILVFLSFWAQYQANQRQWGWIKKQEEEKEYERIQTLIKLIQTEHLGAINERIGYYYYGQLIVSFEDQGQFDDPQEYSNKALEYLKKIHTKEIEDDAFYNWMFDLLTNALQPFGVLLEYYHSLNRNSYLEIINIQIDKIIRDFALQRFIAEMLREIEKYEEKHETHKHVFYLKFTLEHMKERIDKIHSLEKYR